MQLEVPLAEDFEQNVNKMSVKGQVTVLSRRLQIIGARIEYVPITTFATRNTFVVSIAVWIFIFFFWLGVLVVIQIYD